MEQKNIFEDAFATFKTIEENVKNKIDRIKIEDYGRYFVNKANEYAEKVYNETDTYKRDSHYLGLTYNIPKEKWGIMAKHIRRRIREAVELAYLEGTKDGRKNPDKGPVAKGTYDGSRELMLTFVYGDNDSAEDVGAAAQKYADIYNEASLNHDTEKLDKLETISEFSNILKKEFGDIVKEQYNSDDIGYIDFDNQSNYTKGSIEHTIEELFTKYKSIQEKNVLPSLSNFWCNGEMCIVRILYGYAEVFIA